MAHLVGGRWLSAAERKGGKDGEEFFSAKQRHETLGLASPGQSTLPKRRFPVQSNPAARQPRDRAMM